MRIRLLLLLCCLMLLGCRLGGGQRAIVLDKDDGRARQELLKYVPPGTRLDAADVILRQNGFMPHESLGYKQGPPADNTMYIYTFSERAGLLTKRAWSVNLKQDSGVVIDITVHSYLTGMRG